MVKDKNKILCKLKKYDCITFDIFDTLVCRCVVEPFDIIKIVAVKVSKFINHNPNKFINDWQKATNYLKIKKQNRDFSFDEIYTQIQKQSHYTLSQIEYIKKIHLETELQFVIPRQDIKDIYDYLLNRNKKIIIISDMYYSSAFLKKLLNHCGYFGFSDIIVSNELNLTKESGKLWKYFIKKYKKTKWIHVGDSFKADYLNLIKRFKVPIHILSSLKISSKTFFKYHNPSITLSIIYGLILNKILFNSPFVDAKKAIDTPFKYGYSIIAPFFFYFFTKFLPKCKYKKLLFVSREGWYFQKIYLDYINAFNLINTNNKIPESYYLYASRRAALMSSIKTYGDAKRICNSKILEFCGDSKLFFKSKFNIDIKKDENFIVRKKTLEKISHLLFKYKNAIINKAEQERKDYLNYLKTIVTTESALVDYGGSGTIQYYLSKILGFKLDGVYLFKTKSNLYKGIKKICPISIDISGKNGFIIYHVFESFLTAPHGQFVMYKNKPYFASDKSPRQKNIIRDNVYFGVKAFINELSKLLPPNFTINDTDMKFTLNVLKLFYKQIRTNYKRSDIVQLLTMEDVFNGNSKIGIFKKNYGKTKN